METTYTHETTARRSGGVRSRRGALRGRPRKGVALAPKERRRLIQLCVCAALFALAFFGRGIFPEQLDNTRAELLAALHSDTDFRAAFASLGRSISSGEPVTETLGSLWVDVFAAQRRTPMPGYGTADLPAYERERTFLVSAPTPQQVLAHRTAALWGREEPVPETVMATPEPVPTPALTPSPAPQPEVTLPPQPQIVYTGPALPTGATMDMVELAVDRMAAPVMAALSSTYGWREHPIAGGEKFHSGVDLAADYGSTIGAFADGVVDYIGESPAYGQYLQIKHPDGVTSFYAHCSKLCAQPGQAVKAGDKVAEVGDTGNVTGAHLHFEIKKDGQFLNPLNYIQTLPS